MVNTSQSSVATDILLSKINYLSNGLYVTRDSKSTRICSKIIPKQNLFKNTRPYQQQIASRAQTVTDTASATKQISLIGNNVTYQLSNLTAGKPTSRGRGYENGTAEKKESNFVLLSPKLIASYITGLLEKNTKAKYGMDTTNLSTSIPMYITRLMYPFKDSLLGVKILCSGK